MLHIEYTGKESLCFHQHRYIHAYVIQVWVVRTLPRVWK